MTKYFWTIKKKMIQKCVVIMMTKYFWTIKKNNDTKVCCHKDDKVLLDDSKKIMTQKCVVVMMTKYFLMIQNK